MKTMSVDDGPCDDLAEAAMDEADRPAIERALAEAAEQGGVEFEEFFDKLLRDQD